MTSEEELEESPRTRAQQENSDLGDRIMRLLMVAFEEKLMHRSMVLVMGDNEAGYDIQSATPHDDPWDQAVASVMMLGRSLRRIAASVDEHRKPEMLRVVQESLSGPAVARIVEADG